MRRKDIEEKIIGHIRPLNPEIVFVLFDNVVESVRSSGLILPPTMNSSIRQPGLIMATVVAVGRKINELMVGDRVIIKRGYGNKIPSFGFDNLRYLSECQVEAVVENDADADDFDFSTHELTL